MKVNGTEIKPFENDWELVAAVDAVCNIPYDEEFRHIEEDMVLWRLIATLCDDKKDREFNLTYVANRIRDMLESCALNRWYA